MKKFLVLATFLFSAAALACPNLAGNYSCASYDEDGNPITVKTTISQAVANGVTSYTWTTPDDSNTMPADGIMYEYKDKNEDNNDVTYNWSLTCDGGDAIDQFVSYREVDAAGNELDFVQMITNTALDASNNLIQTYDVVYQGNNYHYQSPCTRL